LPLGFDQRESSFERRISSLLFSSLEKRREEKRRRDSVIERFRLKTKGISPEEMPSLEMPEIRRSRYAGGGRTKQQKQKAKKNLTTFL